MLRALYVDFNSYFASVEQQLRPELRGKPVAVLPVMTDTTCCIAASYEAKAFGIKTGTLVREARQRCPELILVESRPALYIDMHHQLIAAVESCLHVEQVRSIDEMWCKLSGRDQKKENAIALARQIKQAIAQQVGAMMRCSIGIAPNRYLAKTASDMQKPDGLTVIEQNDLPDCLYRLELRDLNGVGRAMEKRLHSCGIHTVEQLCQARKEDLHHAWRGIEGERMYARLRGEAVPELESQRSSVGHSHVLPPALRNAESVYAVLHRLTQKACMRLRSYHCVAGRLQLSVKFVDGWRWHNDTPLDPTHDTRHILKGLEHLWRDFPKGRQQIPLAVSMTLTDLTDATALTPSLFESHQSQDQLNAVIDSLNLRFGKNTLYFGGAHVARDQAPMRIAFTHIPDRKLEDETFPPVPKKNKTPN
ncbi:MAG: DNA polymerase [Burkholderiaceae bacterium]|nr:MAG: DNA polymerase [Burkholderiaceae bacterium]